MEAAVNKQLGSLRFGDLEGCQLSSDGLALNACRRVLWFHAKRACLKAKERGWDQILSLPQVPPLTSPVADPSLLKAKLDMFFDSGQQFLQANQGIGA